MIVVTIGTNEQPFDRLIRAARALDRDDLLVQYGSSREPHGRGEWVEFLTFDELSAQAADDVLLATDLHAGNVLRAEREPWLAIDPKPIVAERAYDTVAIVRDAQPALAELRRRLDALSELLGLDRERMRLWGLVKSLAWDDPDQARLFSEVGSR